MGEKDRQPKPLDQQVKDGGIVVTDTKELREWAAKEKDKGKKP